MQNSLWPSWSENKLFTILISILLIVLIVFIGYGFVYKMKSYDYIGVSPEAQNTIRITGIGKVIAVPDIAKVTLGTEALEQDVASAQKKVNEDINDLIRDLKKQFGIKEEDIKTVNYNAYPEYDWSEEGRIFKGYKVTQNVEVKVRETDDAGQVISLAGQLGLKNIGGLQFTIDDPEIYRQEARGIALENAKEKAEDLAEVVGVKLGRIVSFSESEGVSAEPVFREAVADMGIGAGGEVVPAPEIEVGSQEIQVIATVEYEIL